MGYVTALQVIGFQWTLIAALVMLCVMLAALCFRLTMVIRFQDGDAEQREALRARLPAWLAPRG